MQGHDVLLMPPRERLDLLGPRDLLIDWLSKTTPDALIHLAGSMPPASERELFANNVGATYAVLHAMDRAVPIARVVIASSAAVYGEPVARVPISSNAPLHPMNAYGVSKVAQEDVAVRTCQRLQRRLTIARIFNIVGAERDSTSVLPALVARIAQARHGERLIVRNGSCVRDFIDVADVASALLTFGTSTTVAARANVCTGKPTSILGLAARIAQNIGKDLDLQNEDVQGDDTIRWSLGEPTELRRLGWQPQIGLDQSIAAAVDFYRSCRTVL